uniref:Uncharacterized protein n=1 Tax=Xiphophorus couchianus TaxID=32473 RepID=A0A3B5LW30_9TELE
KFIKLQEEQAQLQRKVEKLRRKLEQLNSNSADNHQAEQNVLNNINEFYKDKIRSLNLDLDKEREKIYKLRWKHDAIVKRNEAEDQEEAHRRRLTAINTDIDSILRDIANLEDIRNSIPAGCYNTPPIEEP